MNANKKEKINSAELRQLAEQKLRQKKALVSNPKENPDDYVQMLHELRVHQIELEMQNDELRTAEIELDASRARYFNLYNLAPVGYMTVTKDGMISEPNLTAAAMLGVTQSALVKQKLSQFIFKQDQDIYYFHRKKLFETLQPHSCEIRMLRKDSSLFWASINANIAEDTQDHPLAHFVITDISKMKKVQFDLDAEKERLAVTLRSIGDGVITTDTQAKIIMLNKVAEELTGWTSDQAIGQPLSKVFNTINQLTHQQYENPVAKVLVTGKVVESANHTCLITKDAQEIVITDSGAPIYDNHDKIIGVVLVFRDISEKQKLDDYIQKTQKLESLGILAGGIAHDFNNLLGCIFGYTELAINETTQAQVSNDLKESLSNINRARALTQQLLTFAKGGTPIKKIDNLFPCLQKIAQFTLSGSSVSNKFKIQENLWPCDFDKNQISQVISNLIINAQQAMPNGGIIEVSAHNISLCEKDYISLAAGNYVKLSIKDQGVGIPKEFLPRIFDPYYTTKPKGHGLGLATCYSIISQHDGFIEAESEPGKGSTFHIYLPAASDSISTIKEKSAVKHKHKGSGTFLVMDDDEFIRDIMKTMLESFGYKVVLKANGKDAVDFCLKEFKANRKIAAMLFDLTIPGGMGGKEAISEIKKICPKTPAFVASGYSVDPIMANPEEYGFNASISKPFMMNDLSDMLEKHLK